MARPIRIPPDERARQWLKNLTHTYNGQGTSPLGRVKAAQRLTGRLHETFVSELQDLMTHEDWTHVLNLNDRKMLRILLVHSQPSAVLRTQGARGDTLFWHATSERAIEWLAGYQVDPNVPRFDGRIPVHKWQPSHAAFLALVRITRNLDHQDIHGNTALHIHAASAHHHAVAALLEAGASPWVRNSAGQRPDEVPTMRPGSNDATETAAALREALAKTVATRAAQLADHNAVDSHPAVRRSPRL